MGFTSIALVALMLTGSVKVDVSLMGGEVRIADPTCPVRLDLSGDDVKATAVKSSACAGFNLALRRRKVEDAQGTFQCEDSALRQKATMVVSRASAEGARISITQAGDPTSYPATFEVPATTLTFKAPAPFPLTVDHPEDFDVNEVEFLRSDWISWKQGVRIRSRAPIHARRCTSSASPMPAVRRRARVPRAARLELLSARLRARIATLAGVSRKRVATTSCVVTIIAARPARPR